MGRLVAALDGIQLEPNHLEREWSKSALEVARSTWRRRMAHEHQSSAVFSRLHPQLIEAEATIAIKVAVLESAIEELEHAVLAGQVAVLLGGEASLDVDLATEPLPEHEGCTPRERALRNAIFASCMSETVSVALLTAEREDTIEPAIRGVADRLLRDEIGHAKLGWLYLAETWPHLDDPEKRRTELYIPPALAHLERRMLEQMPLASPEAIRDETWNAELRALGVLPSHEARELFFETKRDVIVPQLRAHGLNISG